MRTQIAIVGAGPAGLFLALLLEKAGIDSVVLERQSLDYVEGRVRAGVLEQVTVGLMDELGIGARMHREGIVHNGTNLSIDGQAFRIDFKALTGSSIVVYGQSEVMKDLNVAATTRGLHVVYSAENVQPGALDSPAPFVAWQEGNTAKQVHCDFVVGCDGYHGVSRGCIPDTILKTYERLYPFGWLGILAEVPPCEDELVYANHDRGFALASMRSRTRSRYYIQCSLEDRIEDWPDDRFWDEVCVRLGADIARRVTRGPSFEKSIAPLRSFVCEPMRWKRLFLAGDAAHIVPPTGAKGLNLAVSDVIYLAEALIEYYTTRSEAGLNAYSDRALARVWGAERFSWWFTGLTHRFPNTEPFDRQTQIAELKYIRRSQAAQTTLAENYVGMPL